MPALPASRLCQTCTPRQRGAGGAAGADRFAPPDRWTRRGAGGLPGRPRLGVVTIAQDDEAVRRAAQRAGGALLSGSRWQPATEVSRGAHLAAGSDGRSATNGPARGGGTRRGAERGAGAGRRGTRCRSAARAGGAGPTHDRMALDDATVACSVSRRSAWRATGQRFSHSVRSCVRTPSDLTLAARAATLGGDDVGSIPARAAATVT